MGCALGVAGGSIQMHLASCQYRMLVAQTAVNSFTAWDGNPAEADFSWQTPVYED